MTDRTKALAALEGLRLTAFVIDAAHEKNVATTKAATDLAYSPEDNEDEDPVGAEPGWIIELTNGEEWVRAVGPMPEGEARELVSKDAGRARWTGDGEPGT